MEAVATSTVPWLFSKEAMIGYVRTIMPFIYSYGMTRIPKVLEVADTWGLDEAALVPILGGFLYVAIRALAEKWGWVGYLLGVNKKPRYAGVTETVAVPPAQ